MRNESKILNAMHCNVFLHLQQIHNAFESLVKSHTYMHEHTYVCSVYVDKLVYNDISCRQVRFNDSSRFLVFSISRLTVLTNMESRYRVF